MSALPPKADILLFTRLPRLRGQVAKGHRDAQRFGGLDIDHHLELGRRLRR